MDWIAELAALMPPPAAETQGIRPDDAAWQESEVALGVKIPADYKAFIAKWGGDGKIADHFLFYVPGSSSDSLALPRATQRAVASYEELRTGREETLSQPPFPEVGSFFPIGITDNGDRFGWMIGAGAPETWQVAWLGDEEILPEAYPMGFGPWLVALVQGKIEGEALWIPPADQLPMQFKAFAGL